MKGEPLVPRHWYTLHAYPHHSSSAATPCRADVRARPQTQARADTCIFPAERGALPHDVLLGEPHPRAISKNSPEETPNPRRDSKKQGDTMCMIVSDVYYRPVFSESLLGFGVSSVEFRDNMFVMRRDTIRCRMIVYSVTQHCDTLRLSRGKCDV